MPRRSEPKSAWALHTCTFLFFFFSFPPTPLGALVVVTAVYQAFSFPGSPSPLRVASTCLIPWCFIQGPFASHLCPSRIIALPTSFCVRTGPKNLQPLGRHTNDHRGADRQSLTRSQSSEYVPILPAGIFLTPFTLSQQLCVHILPCPLAISSVAPPPPPTAGSEVKAFL